MRMNTIDRFLSICRAVPVSAANSTVTHQALREGVHMAAVAYVVLLLLVGISEAQGESVARPIKCEFQV